MSYDRFSDLTGTDYSEGAIDLAKKIATRDGFTNINFLVRIIFNNYNTTDNLRTCAQRSS